MTHWNSPEIPKYLYRMGLASEGIIGVTQPRRIAAISVANWVAKEINVKLGEEVLRERAGRRLVSH